MNTFARTIRRAVAALALVGAVSAAALGSGVAQAAGPQIAVTVVGHDSVLQVTGSGFGLGDPVGVYVNMIFGPEISAQTTASATMPICSFITGKCYGFKPGGYVTVVTTAQCAYAGSVYAVDLTTNAVSNLVQLREGAC